MGNNLSFCGQLSKKKKLQMSFYFVGVAIVLLTHLLLLGKPKMMNNARAVYMHAILNLIALAMIVFSVIS